MLIACAEKQDRASSSNMPLQTGYKIQPVTDRKKRKCVMKTYDYMRVCIMYIYPILQALY